MHVKLQNDTIILTPNLAFRGFVRFGAKTSYRLVNRGPVVEPIPCIIDTSLIPIFTKTTWDHIEPLLIVIILHLIFFSHQTLRDEQTFIFYHSQVIFEKKNQIMRVLLYPTWNCVSGYNLCTKKAGWSFFSQSNFSLLCCSLQIQYFVCSWFNTRNTWSALWILMIWCFSDSNSYCRYMVGRAGNVKIDLVKFTFATAHMLHCMLYTGRLTINYRLNA